MILIDAILHVGASSFGTSLSVVAALRISSNVILCGGTPSSYAPLNAVVYC
jgi:hypothetical protein